MSTVIVDTQGGSVFADNTSVITSKLGGDFLNQFNISLNNTDKKPELKPSRRVIDVVNDFSWYAGPKATADALNKVPTVFLTEREQLLSSLISGSLYYLNASAEATDQFINSAAIDSALGKISEGVKTVAKSGLAAASESLNSFKELVGGSASDQALLANNNLKSLAGIYFTKPTGFQYRLPIYNGSYGEVGSAWSEAGGIGGGSKLQEFVGKAQGFIDEISAVVNFAQPGVYIESPQYFQGAEQGRTETITFPLANTIRRGTVSPIQQNYELLWLLAFQNKPYRTSFSRTPPPKIYSVTVPGQFSMPYAYISNMSVEFSGTIRKSSVFVPSGKSGTIGSKKITTPVPEAYQVSISFTSLIGDYGNTMLGADFNTLIDRNRVTISNK